MEKGFRIYDQKPGSVDRSQTSPTPGESLSDASGGQGEARSASFYTSRQTPKALNLTPHPKGRQPKKLLIINGYYNN